MIGLRRGLPVAAALVLLGLPASSACGAVPPPGAGYHWAQPGTAVLSTPGVQPPAWVPIAVPLLVAATPGSAYAWAQPGTAPVDNPSAQPPASVPASTTGATTGACPFS
jgi:hypothetical protein